YRRILARVRSQLRAQARSTPIIAQHEARLVAATGKFVREHFRLVRRVANFVAYDRLFALWHKVHLPFFYLMLITVVIHVIAVHWYAL
ncbi:MAG: transcriptional regulator, partial [Pseudomonadota bacterium]